MNERTNQTLSLLPPAEFTLPAYGGGSIGNVPATIAALLGVPFQGLPQLEEHLWRPLQDGVDRVVLLVIDAFGRNYLPHLAPAELELLGRSTVSGQLTSIFPSTTVAALSSFWTGAAPAQHGLLGLNIFFPEFASGGQMIHLSPTFARFGSYTDQLVEAGLNPETFLAVPGFAAQLEAAGVETHALKGKEISDSVLSRMHGRGLTGNHGVVSFADMLVAAAELLVAGGGKRQFISLYWPSVDSMSHRYGWDHPRTLAELRALLRQVETEFVGALSPEAREGTALIITADHGQINCPPAQRIAAADHPRLMEMLFMRPLGEPRVAYLYARHGRVEDIMRYVETHLAHAMVPLRATEALAAGLFGPLPLAESAATRVGDVVLCMREGYLFLLPEEMEKADWMIGRHGGMTDYEMQVPWLGYRLDA